MACVLLSSGGTVICEEPGIQLMKSNIPVLMVYTDLSLIFTLEHPDQQMLVFALFVYGRRLAFPSPLRRRFPLLGLISDDETGRSVFIVVLVKIQLDH